MKEVLFIDTHYLLALVNPDDQWHAAAAMAASEIAGRCVTTDAVLLELADALCRRPHRAAAARAITELRADADVECVPVDGSLFARGFELYRNRGDKDWSLTDCVSFALMTQRKISAALTGDVHFEQAGFRALLRR